MLMTRLLDIYLLSFLTLIDYDSRTLFRIIIFPKVHFTKTIVSNPFFPQMVLFSKKINFCQIMNLSIIMI